MSGSIVAVRALRRDLRVLEREVGLSLAADTDCCGVTAAQCHLLLEVEQRGRSSATELSAALALDKSTLSRTVDGLCRAGLLRRDTDPSSRRQQVLSLTRKGTARVASINATCDATYTRLLDFVPANRRAMLARSVALLAAAMRQMRTSPDVACCTNEEDDGEGELRK
jgi:DNA-binding MarR family transcriptional regulator